MDIDEVIERFERQEKAAQAVLDSGFGAMPGESNRLYLERKEMAAWALLALRWLRKQNFTGKIEKEKRTMSDIKVNKKEIDRLMNSANVKVQTVFGKCTVVTMQLESGFALTESSGCVDPANYDPELGKRMCYEHIENRLWELEGYALQKKVYEERKTGEWPPRRCNSGSFGWAIECLKYGRKLRRRGWNGKGIFVELQRPDANSKMSHPYIYIDTTGLQTDNEDAPRSRVPWLASQTDMLAEDWELVD